MALTESLCVVISLLVLYVSSTDHNCYLTREFSLQLHLSNSLIHTIVHRNSHMYSCESCMGCVMSKGVLVALPLYPVRCGGGKDGLVTTVHTCVCL